MVGLFVSILRHRFITADLLSDLHGVPKATITRDLRFLFHHSYLSHRLLAASGASPFTMPLVRFITTANYRAFRRELARQRSRDPLGQPTDLVPQRPTLRTTSPPFLSTSSASRDSS